jgi:hypothetical protein
VIDSTGAMTSRVTGGGGGGGRRLSASDENGMGKGMGKRLLKSADKEMRELERIERSGGAKKRLLQASGAETCDDQAFPMANAA